MAKEELITPQKPKVIRRRTEWVVDGIGKVAELAARDPEVAKAAGEAEVLYECFAVLGIPVQGGIAQVPVEFMLEAASVDDAFVKFPEAAMENFHKKMQEAREFEQKQANRIVVPKGPVPNMKIVE